MKKVELFKQIRALPESRTKEVALQHYSAGDFETAETKLTQAKRGRGVYRSPVDIGVFVPALAKR